MLEAIDSDILLIDKIAAGGMAEIFLAKQIGSGNFERNVAVKRVYPHFSDKVEFKQLFLREVSLSARLQHPNIVQVIKTIEHKDNLYLVMEMINGKDLRYLLNTKLEIPEPVALYIISEILAGLDYAHNLKDEFNNQNLNTIHCDISPGNILLDFSGAIKIADFGIAKASDSVSFTKTGSIKGKFEYLAPELVDGKKASAQSDLFSVGVILFELLAGFHLFADDSPTRVLLKVKECKVPDLKQLKKLKTPELQIILNKAINADPNQRYKSAAEFQRDARKILSYRYPDFSPSDYKNFIREALTKEIKIESEKLNSMIIKSGYYEYKTGNIETSVTNAIQISKSRLNNPKYKIAGILFILMILATCFSYYFSKAIDENDKLGIVVKDNFKSAKNIKPLIPSDVSGLLAWFDPKDLSQDISINTWQTKDNKLSQENLEFQPKLQTEKNLLSFDGINDYLSGNELTNNLRSVSGITVFVIAAANKEDHAYIWSLQNDNQNDIVKLGFDNSKLEIKYQGLKNSALHTEDFDTKQLALYTLRLDGNNLTVKRNGKQLINNRNPQKISFSESKLFSLGQEWDINKTGELYTSDHFAGLVGDLIIYSKTLDDSTIQSLEKFLMNKYKLKE